MVLTSLGNYAARFLLLALTYLAVARLSLLLAIPPGFASPVWPAAGIALAGVLLGGFRYLPAVFLGSFAANLMTAVNSTGSITGIVSYAVAAGIALGALLETAVGAYLIRRVVRLPAFLEDEREIGLLLVLGGPIACTVNATFGPLVLVLAGSLELQNYLLNWFHWWVGDTIGVVLILPTILILVAPNTGVSTVRKWAVIAPMVLIFLLVLALFFYSRNHSENEVYAEFERLAGVQGDTVEEKLNLYQEIIHSLERFYYGSDHVSRQDFGEFVGDVLRSEPGISALGWVPRVPYAERQTYSDRARQDGLEDFRILEREASGLLPAGTRQEYYPLFYMEPRDGNEELLGLDLATCTSCWRAMEDARDSGLPIATADNAGFRRDDARPGVLVFHPVYETRKTLDTLGNRRRYLRGFVMGEFFIEDVIGSAMPDLPGKGLNLNVYDNYIPGEAALRYGEADEQTPFFASVLLQAVGRQWTLEFFPTSSFLQQRPGWQAWQVLIGGLFFTTLLQAFLLLVTARTEVVKRRVEEQTVEIRSKNAALEQMVHKLNESNAELERFAYVASHDLKEPLRKVSSYTSLLESHYGDKLDEKARLYIDAANDSADRMRQLIEDILEYARLGNDDQHVENVDANHSMQLVLENLHDVIERSGAEIIYEKLPVVQANPARMLRLLQNLVGNAIKYQKPGAKPRVEITTSEQEDAWLFAVRDNGIGMKQEYCKRIFEPFERLHGKKEYPGTGLGLSICQKIVEGFGGEIWAESAGPDKGSIFYFTVPKHTLESENYPSVS